MKKILIIGGGMLFAAALAAGLWFWADNPRGRWKSAGQGEFDIFEGSIRIAEVESRPGSLNKSFMIIYDDTYHAMSCGSYGGQRFDICVPFEMKAGEVKSGQRLEDIIEYAYLDPMYLQMHFRNYIFFQRLELSLVPMNEECRSGGECDFMPVGRFKRFWKFGF